MTQHTARGRRAWQGPATGMALFAATIATAGGAVPAQGPDIDYHRLVPGFLAENFDERGRPSGTGFAEPNPWGAYTAYRLATNDKGQRTWRIENYLPGRDGGFAQGSTMYLFEGSERALLVDTGQNTPDVPGQSDLTTVVRHLLGHDDGGRPRTDAVDFVVAITHRHGDHTGKNAQMSDRPVYYPDLDWPADAPANYVPIKEGGGPSEHAHGVAVGQINLGDRRIDAVDIHQHTPGSTGYLDAENRMIATGDAIGSAYVWAQFGTMTQYRAAVRHLRDALEPFDEVAVLPAHFYQVAADRRRGPPLSGRPLDKTYVADQVAAAESSLRGDVVAEPYPVVGREAVIATVRSAQICYTLARLYPGGIHGGNGDPRVYHAVAIPGPAWTPVQPGTPYAALNNIRSDFFLIRDHADTSLYLVKGTTRALLVGTGSGTPALSAFVRRLAGPLPLDVIVTSDDADQVGGLAQFSGGRVYLPRNADVDTSVLTDVVRVGEGDVIELGLDRDGRPVQIEVHPLGGHSAAGLTLLSVNDRVLLGGDALGTQGADAGLLLRGTLADFQEALAAWRARTDGRYDVLYTAHNYQWFTSPD